MKSPRAQGLFAKWEQMFNEPFRGITTDGHVIPDLYAPRPEGAPTLAMIEAVNALLGADVAGAEEGVVLSGRFATSGGTGRTPSFTSSTTGCASTRSASRCARR